MVSRVSFATLPVPEVGVAIAIDFAHLFRSKRTLDYYFSHGLDQDEAEQRQREFRRLSGRDDQRKGTLLYDWGSKTLSQCYFSHDPQGKTCADVGPLEFGGERYESLYEYYQKKRRRLKVAPEDPVVYVSFPGLRGQKPVAAKLLRLRVTLDPQSMPRELRTATTLAPTRRQELSRRLWESIPRKWIAEAGLSLASGFWRPGDRDCELLAPPKLVFGTGRVVIPPSNSSIRDYQSYFRVRRERLEQAGVFSFDESAGRDLILVTPPESERWSAALQKAFIDGLVACVSAIAKRTFRVILVRGESCDSIVQQLRERTPGNAIIVFDDRDKATYSLLSHELPGWTLKRMTRRRIEQAWKDSHDGQSGSNGARAARTWQDMTFHSAIDFLDQIRATPWRLGEWAHDACLAIDVSEERRYYGLSLLVCRNDARWPAFRRVTRTWPKADYKRETIEPTVLEDKIAGLLGQSNGFEPLSSLLVLRDGREYGDEVKGIHAGLGRWTGQGVLASDATIHVADVLKKSVKHVRMWMALSGTAANVLEGQVIYPDDRTAILCCTGAATLPDRGTAEPIIIRGHTGCDIRRAAAGVFALSQLNYSSPTKANRYPQPLRELDAVLRDRADRDVRGMK
jgi:hypothetical protein